MKKLRSKVLLVQVVDNQTEIRRMKTQPTKINQGREDSRYYYYYHFFFLLKRMKSI